MKNRLILLLLAWAFIIPLVNGQASKNKKGVSPLRVLVFSKTKGFRHSSIPNGIKMIAELSVKNNWVVTATEEPALFEKSILSNFDVILFLSPTGDVLNEWQQAAMENFIRSGKGFVGIHAAADCEYDWTFYGQLVGAYFKTHPPTQEATVKIENDTHATMAVFKGKKTYTITDEWYTYRKNPRKEVNVLASLDESTIKKEPKQEWKMGDHPIMWYHQKFGGRSFYTDFGHTKEQFDTEVMKELIKSAVEWAGKRIN